MCLKYAEKNEGSCAMPERECVVCGATFTPPVKRGVQPLTCSEACKKKRKTEANLRWRKTAVIPESAHGTISGYTNYGCDCARCRAANAEYQREVYERNKPAD